jgi:hypothetical protein
MGKQPRRTKCNLRFVSVEWLMMYMCVYLDIYTSFSLYTVLGINNKMYEFGFSSIFYEMYKKRRLLLSLQLHEYLHVQEYPY